MIRPVIVLLVLVSASVSSAQVTTISTAAPKRQETALRCSFISTAVPVVAGGVVYFGFSDRFDNWDDAESIVAACVGGAGVILGPGVGHAYAGNSTRMVTGALLRGALLGIIPLGVAWKSAMEGDESAGPGIILIAPAVLSAAYDIATVGQSVDRYNRKHRLDARPVSLSASRHHGTIGLAVTLSW